MGRKQKSTLAFEPFWDDLPGVWRVSVFGHEAEPVTLPGAARGHGGPLFKYISAAAMAVPSARSDQHGMYWSTKDEATKAATAASKAK